MKNTTTIAVALAAFLFAPTMAHASQYTHLSEREELACDQIERGDYEAAIAKLNASGARDSGDPAMLINLGTAFANKGEKAMARQLYLKALRVSDDVEVQLENGRWVPHYRAVRVALASLEKS